MNGRIDSVSRFIAASPHTLYQAFITPDSLVEWMPPQGITGTIESFNPTVGEGYRMTLTYEDVQTTAGKTAENTDTLEIIFIKNVPFRNPKADHIDGLNSTLGNLPQFVQGH